MPDKSYVSRVQFHFLLPSSLPKERTRLKSFVLGIFKTEKTTVASITYVFCSDDYLLGINKQFLHHDYYTDIVSFNLAGKNKACEGEIYISLERVKDNAKTLQGTFERELHRVIFHGALHLCGYKDKKPAEIALMRSKEDSYLDLYFKK